MATRSDAGIVNAVLAVHLEDGTILCCEGKPAWVEDFTVGIESSSDQIDFGVIRPGRFDRLRLEPPKRYVIFNGRWSDPTLSTGKEVRGWRNRFKKWLKEFPTS